jgi:hypothetical protein
MNNGQVMLACPISSQTTEWISFTFDIGKNTPDVTRQM